MQLVVDITEDDVRFSARRDPARCPITNALRRLPGVTDASIMSFGGELMKDGRIYSTMLPERLSLAVRLYDRGGRFLLRGQHVLTLLDHGPIGTRPAVSA